MKTNYKKYAIITLVAAFSILTGLDIKSFLKDTNIYKELIDAVIHFSLMSVMFYEWMKILRQEKEIKI